MSRICTEIKTQFQEWSARRLDDVSLDYLFVDGSHFKYHANAAAEPVLAAWGIDTDGKPVFIGLEAASSESATRGKDSLPGWVSAGWPARCWSFPTARPDWSARSNAPWAPHCASAVLSTALEHRGQGAQKRRS